MLSYAQLKDALKNEIGLQNIRPENFKDIRKSLKEICGKLKKLDDNVEIQNYEKGTKEDKELEELLKHLDEKNRGL